MGQIRSREQRHQKNGGLQRRYQETIDTVVKAGYVHKFQQI